MSRQPHQDALFVTIIVRDRSGKRVAAVKNAKFESGIARIEQIISAKYQQQESVPIPPLVASMMGGERGKTQW